MTREYAKERWRRVSVAYTNFRSTLKQEAKVHTLLPIDRTRVGQIIEGILPESGRFANGEEGENSQGSETKGKYSYEYAFEPSSHEILRDLLPHLFLVALYHIILECNASEHSARMVAMKNASDNADELVKELTLHYNKARQSAITQELAEITGGTIALET